MARKFITQKEIDYIDRINKELIQNIVGQEVIYYQIMVEHTKVHRLYNEAVNKVWAPPVRVNARVMYDNTEVTSTNFTLDSQYELEVYFHRLELQDRNLVPKEGDFLEFGQIYYEITSVTIPQLVFGQVNNKIMTKCVCVPSREGNFQAGGDSSKGIDNSNPINNSNSSTDCT